MSTRETKAPAEKPSYDVFISHSSKDKSYADLIVKQLEEHGIRCWIAPRDIIPGSDYGEAIISGIEGCRTMVLIFSQHANESPQIIREVERAVHHRVNIVPFRVENIPPKRSLEYFISAPHWLDAYSGPIEPHIEYLAKTIEHLIGKSDSVPKPPIITALLPNKFKATAISLLGKKKSIAVASAVLFFAVLFIRYLLTPPPVEAVFLGKWQTALPNSEVVLLPEVSSGGSYRVKTVVEELGQIDIRRGQVYLMPVAGFERLIVWDPIDENTARSSLIPNSFWGLAVLGGSFETLGRVANLSTKAIWKRSTNPDRPGVLVWSFEPNIQGYTWKITFETGPGSTYRFRAELDDTGRMYAKEGKWTIVMAGLKPFNGTYEVLDENSIAMMTPLAQTVWKRRK